MSHPAETVEIRYRGFPWKGHLVRVTEDGLGLYNFPGVGDFVAGAGFECWLTEDEALDTQAIRDCLY